MGDSFIIEEKLNVLKKRLDNFISNEISEDLLNREYGLGKNYAQWILENKPNIKLDDNKYTKFSYRPFDDKYTYFDNKLIWRWRVDVMQHFIKGENVGIDLCRQLVSDSYSHIFVTNKIVDDSFVSNKSRERGYVFPLYLYPDNHEQQIILSTAKRTPNLNTDIIKQIAEKLGLTFTNEKETTENTFAPIDILDYIYAVLHSPNYREKYKEFLKIDFPRVPYPKDQNTFWQLVKLGEEIRQIHLLESPIVEKYITQYPIDGDNIVTKPKYQDGKVYINNTQYFNHVPEIAWNFYIGGYQPAQKWLKDRKDRKLEIEDIFHYQKIIVALTETDRLMKEIDKIAIE
ncbi:adenine specific DNA methyltransferase [Planktothrix agardhii CCAP 1459/11A]|uniref:Adenine specific DNA methyltransferase n=2 Tax=Planktothrix agardhii TaxID=1160 RepID=A0A4P5ZEK8_PLAAG|nr:adenine specific DNA methyltransferase [Planktothrix agardhii CCAP 1459/11A]